MGFLTVDGILSYFYVRRMGGDDRMYNTMTGEMRCPYNPIPSNR